MSDEPPHDTTTLNTREASNATVRLTHRPLNAVLAAIRAQPGELDAIITSSDEALIVFDARRNILRSNRGAEELFGYAPRTLVGTTTDALIPPRLRRPNPPPMTPLAEIMQVDLSGLRCDGSEFAAEWVLGSVERPTGTLFVVLLRDHDVVERAFAELRASEERFRLLVDGVRDYAIYMLDPIGHVSSWNHGAERTQGWTRDEILGKSFEVFFDLADRAAGLPQQLLDSAVRNGSHEISGWRVRRNGTRFRVGGQLTALWASDGTLSGFAKVTRDLTEKFQAEDNERRLTIERARREFAEAAELQLRASEDRLRRLQRMTAALSQASSPGEVASVILDQFMQALEATRGLLYALTPASEAFELLDHRGYATAALTEYATLSRDLRTPIVDAAHTSEPAFFASAAEVAAAYPNLSPVMGIDGLEAAAIVPLISHGKLMGVLCMRFHDTRTFSPIERSILVTLGELCAQALERAKLFAAESVARAAAEAVNRSKDEFLAMLGHELRNPLAPIVTALNLLSLRDDVSSQRERALISRHVKHMVRLVDDLLDVSRIKQGKVELKQEHVELAEIVNRALELSSPLIEQRQHHLAVAVPATGLLVFGDPTRLVQVVTNLLTNAAKYTPPGGNIAVEAHLHEARAVLSVRDDGSGIGPEIMPYVFDLFAQERQSLDRTQGGLGLGLAIVKSLVAMHGGTIAVESDGRGKGSTFTLTLPAAAPDIVLVAERASSSAVPTAPMRRRVLVVDDNVDAAELLGEILRIGGYDVDMAHDGPEALVVAARFRPEIAVLDIGLPVMDGFQLARRMREQFGAVQLIALTGYGQAEDRARATEAGFDLLLIKPVDMPALWAALAARAPVTT